MLKELTTHHREIARLKFEGCRAAEISERLNVPVATVRSVLSDQLCKAHIARLNEQADTSVLETRRRIARMTTTALDRVEDILSPTNENVPWPTVFAASKDVLDRAGHAPKQQVQHTHGHFTIEDIKELRERAQAQESSAAERENESESVIDV